MKVYSPYTNEKIGEITLLNLKEAINVVNKGLEAEERMSSLSAFQKAEILLQLVNGIRKNQSDFIQLISTESGKPYRYAKAEVERVISTLTIASEECKRIPHELFYLDNQSNSSDRKGEYHYFPVGLILGIAPFNFPLNLAMHKIAPAIAAGCPIILKPSSKTPLSIELFERIANESDIPKGGFQVIHCSREIGNEIIKHPAIKVVSFTGSPDVGWEIKKLAFNKRVVLELGGNAAAVVCKSANLNLAIKELMIGSFAYSGQVCIHTQRIYIHESIFDDFNQKFISEAKNLNKEDPLHPDSKFSVMIDKENVDRVRNWIKEAVEDGAHVLLGGEDMDCYHPPSILSNVSRNSKIRNEEVFGPVVILEPFNSLEEVIVEVNDSKWGLQASIFTDQISERDLFFNRAEVGTVVHNLSTTFRVDDMPYGGVKNSGFGVEGIKYAMRDFLVGKLLVR
jgi:acyl-CoA reductase-like NAD-dependent aldehyde dehydrogenase